LYDAELTSCPTLGVRSRRCYLHYCYHSIFIVH